MTCIVCYGEDIELREVLEEIPVGNDLVRVPVNAEVCQSCGERYYNRSTVQYLEEVERKLKAGEMPLKQTGRVLVSEKT